MSSPEVSVIIPTHDRADLLARAIGSVLDQSDVTVEVIVVDDCSSDGTPDLLETFRDRITIIRNATNLERGTIRDRQQEHPQ